MFSFKNIINGVVNLFQKGIVAAKDVGDEIKTILKFKRESIANKLNLTTKEELEIVEKKIQSLNIEIKKLQDLTRKR
jgi:adenosine deaminase